MLWRVLERFRNVILVDEKRRVFASTRAGEITVFAVAVAGAGISRLVKTVDQHDNGMKSEGKLDLAGFIVRLATADM